MKWNLISFDCTKTDTRGADKYNHTMLQRLFTISVRAVLRYLPPGAPMYIYTKLLHPKPLRAIANSVLRRIIPPSITIPEGVLFLNQNDPVVSGALVLGAYEPYFTEEFRNHLTNGCTVADIGANLGYYTLIASAHAKAIVAYEPEKENYTLLEHTIAENQLTNVTLVKKGLGAKEEEMQLILDPDNKGKHTLLGKANGETELIEITTLDVSLHTLNISHVDVIKMDIEGWEAHAFTGMQRVLKESHPTIFVEYSPGRITASGADPVKMLESLLVYGYTLFLIDESKKALIPIDDIHFFTSKFSGSESYENIIAKCI